MKAKFEEHLLIVMDKSTHGGHLSQTLHTNDKQFKIAITFLTGYNGIFNVTNNSNKFILISVFEGTKINLITISPGAYEIESLNKEIKRLYIEDVYITEEDYPFTIKPDFSTLGSIIEIESRRGWQISFVQDYSLRDLLGFKSKVTRDEYNKSDYLVDL